MESDVIKGKKESKRQNKKVYHGKILFVVWERKGLLLIRTGALCTVGEQGHSPWREDYANEIIKTIYTV